jgi:hypothetical protein
VDNKVFIDTHALTLYTGRCRALNRIKILVSVYGRPARHLVDVHVTETIPPAFSGPNVLHSASVVPTCHTEVHIVVSEFRILSRDAVMRLYIQLECGLFFSRSFLVIAATVSSMTMSVAESSPTKRQMEWATAMCSACGSSVHDPVTITSIGQSSTSSCTWNPSAKYRSRSVLQMSRQHRECQRDQTCGCICG